MFIKLFPHFLSSLLFSFIMLSFLLVYFLTGLLPDLSIYFQNKPVQFPDRRSQEVTKPVFIFFVLILCCSILCYGCMFAFVVYFRFFTARRYASAVHAVVMCPSVHPSVRLSVTSRHCTKTAKCRITQTTPYQYTIAQGL